MNSQNFAIAENLIPSSYIQQSVNALRNRENLAKTLMEQRKWPDNGWDDASIELFLSNLALMDSNNFREHAGVGEREGRVVSNLVAKRHYHMTHGIGRSENIAEVQPNATGSSLMIKLVNAMLLESIRFMGVSSATGCFMVPIATGMSLMLCLLTLKQDRPGAKFVLWSRIDQKSCFKCIISAGLQPIIIDPVQCGDELHTDVQAIEAQLLTIGSDNIVCIMSTTSCFAPRASDSLEKIATLCQKYNVPHLINNAYGLQSTRIMHSIQDASKKGRVDVFVQSTDKNFLVPVGGAIIAGFDKNVLEKITKNYPGRASCSPVMDIFITLLSLGTNGYKELISQRKEVHQHLRNELGKIAAKYGERLLDIQNNPISIAMTLKSLSVSNGAESDTKKLSQLSSMMYMRHVTGCRVVSSVEVKDVCGYKFDGWGAHKINYPCPYITAGASIGITKSDIDFFVQKLDKVISRLKKTPISNIETPSSSEGNDSTSIRRKATIASSYRSAVNGVNSIEDGSSSTSRTSSVDNLRK
ncbi:O-phosphoseryl-tRNA(Sec) selenium transferase [Adelges cooleyi]|uniref:O-phosphoseryl-tRNA(Sec) selenium transferase n=1 Tax=Adelges cooleyi TaxID=133065 RepID=UPI0021805FB0|nr:O-phosphoseryl-tRNA(Sec) selenium transferase [Adelges cooleyi]